MLYWLSAFSDTIGPLNVLRYITFRTGGAMITALVFVFMFGPWLIDHLRLRQGKGQPIRSDGPQSHLVTKQTHDGVSGNIRFAVEAVIAAAACYFIISLGREPFASSLTFPFFKELIL